jgi:preprotein translocase subunit SecE
MADDSGRQRRKAASLPKRELDPRRWAYVIYALGAAMGVWLFGHLTEEIWSMAWSYYPQVGRAQSLTSYLIGTGVTAVGTIYAFRRKDYFRFCTEVVIEISQVTWPTRAEIRQATIVVIIMTIICSLILFGMDQVWSFVTDFLYGR